MRAIFIAITGQIVSQRVKMKLTIVTWPRSASSVNGWPRSSTSENARDRRRGRAARLCSGRHTSVGTTIDGIDRDQEHDEQAEQQAAASESGVR